MNTFQSFILKPSCQSKWVVRKKYLCLSSSKREILLN